MSFQIDSHTDTDSSQHSIAQTHLNLASALLCVDFSLIVFSAHPDPRKLALILSPTVDVKYAAYVFNL